MVICKDMKDAEYLYDRTNGAIKDVLLGGLRSGEGKKKIDMNSYMDADDIAVMDSMEKKGAELVMQADPTSKRLTTADIRKSFAR